VEDVFAILATSNVLKEWKSRRRLHDHGGLSSSRGHNERPTEQLSKVGVAATAIPIDEKAVKIRLMRINTVRGICSFAVLFSISQPFFSQSLTYL